MAGENQEAIQEIVEGDFTKSGKIVRLHNLGLTVSEISKVEGLGVTYAHAYAVLRSKGATMRTRKKDTVMPV